MFSRAKTASVCAALLRWRGSLVRAALLVGVLGVMLACPSLRAQQMPTGSIGRVEGNDISVENGTASGAAAANPTPGGYLLSGSVVTVHDGKARLMLAVGGEIDICGPAKLTLLESGGAITLALDFGRIHLQLRRGTSLRIFTPTIIATPLDIGGEARDITAGLDMNDSLCVLATSGAIRLEQQFTGEGIIVPQAGEFFLNSGKLVPIAGAPGSCACTAMHAQSAAPPQIPVLGVSSSARLEPPPQPAEPVPAAAVTPAPKSPEPAPEPNVQLRVLAQADDIHPIVPPAKDAVPPPPPDAMPQYKIIMPPLGFSASSPTPPADPPMGAVLLVRTVHVEPEYEFTGHVEAPHMESLDQGNASSSTRQSAKVTSTGNRKEGFWARLKRAFGGS
jgi:hypothetical protein